MDKTNDNVGQNVSLVHYLFKIPSRVPTKLLRTTFGSVGGKVDAETQP
jgi:hypothetical protein